MPKENPPATVDDGSGKIRAADAIQRFVMPLKALIDAADALREAGSIEAATAEANRQLTAINGMIKDASTELDGINNRITVTRSQSDDYSKRVRAEADAAKVAADQYVHQQELKGERIIASAKTEADAYFRDVKAKAQDFYDGKKREAQEHVEKIAELRITLTALEVERVKKQATLDDIGAKLRALTSNL